MKQTEHENQSAFISWCNYPPTLKQFPELDLIYANQGGARVAWSTANKLKAEGMKSGIPDLHLPVARGEYHGLFLEFKRNDKCKLSPNQIGWQIKLEKQGYKVVVVSGSEIAQDIVKRYLRG